jgi:acyl-CoA hydrolase
LPNALKGHESGQDEVIMTEIVLPSHTNSLGTVFGGVIMSWIDIAGAIAAQRHCRKTVVTASIDDLAFLAGVKVGWFVQVRARVNYTARTSMEVGVRVDAEDPKTGTWHHTASAFTTFVALDEKGKPTPVPQLEANTAEQKKRWDEALKRREYRLKRRAQVEVR